MAIASGYFCAAPGVEDHHVLAARDPAFGGQVLDRADAGGRLRADGDAFARRRRRHPLAELRLVDGDRAAAAARTASRIMKSPTAAGTRMPLAIVCALGERLGEALAALEGPHDRRAAVGLHGDHPRPACRSASQPSSASSSNAFHMPISPVPPPVG